MPLHWDLSKIKDKDSLYWKDNTFCKKTEMLILAMPCLGFPSITEKNYQGVFKRLWIWEKLHGALTGERTEDGATPSPFSLTDIRRHIGLKTNATSRTEKQFGEALFKGLCRDADAEIEKQVGIEE